MKLRSFLLRTVICIFFVLFLIWYVGRLYLFVKEANNYNEIVEGKVYVEFVPKLSPQTKSQLVRLAGLNLSNDYFYTEVYVSGGRIHYSGALEELLKLPGAVSTEYVELNGERTIMIKFSKVLSTKIAISYLSRYPDLPYSGGTYSLYYDNEKENLTIDVPKGKEKYFMKRLLLIPLVLRAGVLRGGFNWL